MNKDQGYVEIIYKIAVVLNESGMLRNTYSNIVPNLISLMENEQGENLKFRKKYRFFSFTRNNLSELFDENNENYLMYFDALFISTNATNDEQVQNILNNNVEIITKFIHDDKGLFIGSQKKLSSKKECIAFLPESESFKYVTRPEKNSSDGTIKIKTIDSCLVKNCNQERINYICHNNKFKNHVYRSFIEPNYSESFEDILVAEEDENRKLLIKSKIYKIIYTTISIDYEEQNELLKNIIFYITEGISTIAFFNNESDNGEIDFSDKFNNLLLNACLNKLPLKLYNNLDITSEVYSNNIFVVSPSYPIEMVNKFWNEIQANSNSMNQKFKKLFYIHNSEAGQNIITEFSSFNNVDIELQKVYQWARQQIVVKTEKKEKERLIKDEKNKKNNTDYKPSDPIKWGVGFWESYDLITFIYELSLVYGNEYKLMIESFGIPFCSSLKKHYRKRDNDEAGSYDGMLNCSTSLLELFVLVNLDYLKKDEKYSEELKEYSIEETLEYVKNYLIDDEYIIDFEVVLISLYNIKRYGTTNPALLSLFSNNDSKYSYTQELLLKVINERFLTIYNDVLTEKFYSTIDLQALCKDIEIISCALSVEKDILLDEPLIIEKLNTILFNHILQIKKLQVNGSWINLNRTASIIKSLSKVFCIYEVDKNCNANVSSIISQIIVESFNYINNEIEAYYSFDENSKNNFVWKKDLMGTVTISYALCLYNIKNKSLSHLIEKSIFDSNDGILSTQVIDNAAIELRTMREKINNIEFELKQEKNFVKELEQEKTNLINEKEKILIEHNNKCEEIKNDNEKNRIKSETKWKNSLKWHRVTIILLLSCILGTLYFIWDIYETGELIDIKTTVIRLFFSFIATVITFCGSIILKNVLEKWVEEIKNPNEKIKKGKKNKGKKDLEEKNNEVN